jgi:hypothetical protein
VKPAAQSCEKSLPADYVANAWGNLEHTYGFPRRDKPVFPKFGREAKTTDRQFCWRTFFLPPDTENVCRISLVGVNLSRYGHRRRLAFRLQAEQAEYLIPEKSQSGRGSFQIDSQSVSMGSMGSLSLLAPLPTLPLLSTNSSHSHGLPQDSRDVFREVTLPPWHQRRL